MQKGIAGPFEILAPAVFVIANLIVAAIALGTLWLLIKGRLVVRPVAINPA
jgi:tellurite resistance protein